MNAPQGYFNTSDSAITASSELGPLFSGVVEIKTPDFDASKGLVTLSLDPVDVSKLIAQRCLADRRGNEFVITGRGGLPPSPGNVLSPNSALEDLGESSPEAFKISSVDRTKVASSQIEDVAEIVEAQQWIIGDRGKVSLVGQIEKHNSQPDSLLALLGCPP